MIIPPKLQFGDEIRIIAPSRSFSILDEKVIEIALQRLSDLGFHTTLAYHVREKDDFSSSSVASRVEDIHEAFSDPDVKGIMTAIGGYNCNQILKYLDYTLIQRNPKILVGFSDITALSNAIWAKTGLVNYSGPHFCNFGMFSGFEDTLEHFQKCVMQEDEIVIRPSTTWSDDKWNVTHEERNYIQNDGWLPVYEGEVEGTIVGGNLCTFNLLQGTEFMPVLDNTILFIEDDQLSDPYTFDRDLQSLLHQPSFKGVKGMVMGRFQKKSNMTNDLLLQIIRNKEELKYIPILANVDIGHTSPMITFPIGGKAKLSVKSNQASLTITEH